jgi:uncharacterized membrane protein
MAARLPLAKGAGSRYLTSMAVLLAVHVIAAVLWVGGMAFAHLCLRPAAEATLPPPQRLPLMRAVLQRFFIVVWAAILALLASGYAAIAVGGGFAAWGWHVHAMQAVGLVMMALFAHLYFAPWRRLNRAVDAQAWPEAGKAMAAIRRIVTINLILGLAVSGLGAAGRWL